MFMDKTDPADWAFVLLLVQLIGMKWLLAAFDGQHYAYDIQTRKRWTALGLAAGVIWIPILAVWVVYGITPVDLWFAGVTWWQANIFIGYVVAIAEWWVLLTPIMMVIAIIRIIRKQREETKVYGMSYVLGSRF